jgi:hypothetical protein
MQPSPVPATGARALYHARAFGWLDDRLDPAR